jgi:hypothetical protein
MVMKGWRKFVDTLELTKDLEQDYFDMRKIFQREEWSDEDLLSPSYFPHDLMELHSRFQPKMREIFQTIKDYGFDVYGDEVHNYIMDKLSHIDDITPLRKSNGNNKRND